MPKTQETVLEIDLTALEHNFHYLKSLLHYRTKFLAVVKAFAYGSDAVKIAQKLDSLGVDYLAVAYVKEGTSLRKAGIKTPILVLHPQSTNFKELINHCLEPSLYSPKILEDFLIVASAEGQKDYPVHLKFNTGLNRLGFRENHLDWIVKQLEGRNEIRLTSIFSHLAASEDLSEARFTQNQIQKFQTITTEVCQKLGYSPFQHLLNTSGIINYPEFQMDMVRSGIGLYGYGNDESVDQRLKPVVSLKTIISQIHEIGPNETVGYNRAFKSKGYGKTATLPLGHADGIGRHYGQEKTFVQVNGKKAPIIGNVCMDMIMINVTGIDCQEGDEVVVFGKSPTAHEFASTANTISYELLTAISPRVKRVFIRD